MTRKRLLVYAVAAGALFAAGWLSRPVPPPKVVTVVQKERETQAWSFLAEHGGQSVAATVKKEAVKIVTRTVYLPGKTTVERVEERGTVTSSSEASSEHASQSSAGHAERTVELEVKRVDLTPRVHLQGMAGVDTSGKVHYGVSASARVLGPVTVGVAVISTAKAVLVLVGASW
jgi:hypothetical protein